MQWDKPTAADAGGAGAAAGGAGAAGEQVDETATSTPEEEAAARAAAGKRKQREVVMAESYDPSAAGKVELKRIEKSEASKCVNQPYILRLRKLMTRLPHSL